MAFKPSNLATPEFVFKFVELVFTFIVFMIFRVGNSGNVFVWSFNDNDNIFGIMTSAGFFFFTIILLFGIALGDNAKMTLFLFNIFGFLFFIALGSRIIDVTRGSATADGMGAMAILTSFLYLLDVVFVLRGIVKKE